MQTNDNDLFTLEARKLRSLLSPYTSPVPFVHTFVCCRQVQYVRRTVYIAVGANNIIAINLL